MAKISDNIPEWMQRSGEMDYQRDWYKEQLDGLEETLTRFTDFVISIDPSIYDAFVFVENNRERGYDD